MNRRLLIPLVTAGAALASGVASANPQYWRDNGLLLEVSADPRDGSDFVQTNPVHANRLEFVALNDAVRLRGFTVRFSDGRTFSQPMRTIMPGERVTVSMPEDCGVIQNVELDYGRQLVDRTPARLQIIPHDDHIYAAPQRQPRVRDHRRWDDRGYGYGYTEPSYYQSQPSYYQSQPTYQYATQPSYRVQPQAGWSGSVQGSFRF